jgi:hypothetical protein
LIALFVFFVPLVPYTTPYRCDANSLGCGPESPRGFITGFNSLGLPLVHWGASSGGFLGGGTYNPPVITDSLGGVSEQLTGFGALIAVVLPLIAACVGLLAPELVRKSRATRIGFIVFGALAFAFSILMVVSLTASIALPGLLLIWEGGLIAFYGLRPWTSHADNMS